MIFPLSRLGGINHAEHGVKTPDPALPEGLRDKFA